MEDVTESVYLKPVVREGFRKLLLGEIQNDIEDQMIEKYKENISKMKENVLLKHKKYNRSLIVDFNDMYFLNNYVNENKTEDEIIDQTVEEMICANPHKAIDELTEILYDCIDDLNEEVELHRKIGPFYLRFSNLNDNVTGLEMVDSNLIDNLIQVKGVVSKVSEKKPMLITAVWRCECGVEQIMTQSFSSKYNPPESCTNEDCLYAGKSNKHLILDINKSEFVKYQKMEVQENIDQQVKGRTLKNVDVINFGDSVDVVQAGSKISVVGILEAISTDNLYKKHDKSLIFHTNILSSSIESYEEDIFEQDEKYTIADFYEKVQTDGEYDKNKAGKWWDTMTAWLSYDYFGEFDIKQAILCQIFSGRKLKKDIYRDKIHILIIGSSGTGKSMLAESVSSIVPKSLFVNSKNASIAGLTAGIVYENSVPAVECGTMVLGDDGLVIIDEIDKMHRDVQSALLMPMERLKVTISKVSTHQELNTRCSILALGNPKENDYNFNKTFRDNTSKIDLALMDRFDLVFVLTDVDPRKTEQQQIGKDLGLSNKILGIQNDYHEYQDLIPEKYMRVERPTEEEKDFFKAYIRFVKNKCKSDPYSQLSQECAETINRYWKERRKQSFYSVKSGEIVEKSISTRFLDSLVRLSIARANALLRNKAEIEDFEIAKKLYEKALESISSELNVNTLITGENTRERDYKNTILTFIKNMQSDPELDYDQGIPYNELKLRFTEQNSSFMQDFIDMKLNSQGMVLTMDKAFEKMLELVQSFVFVVGTGENKKVGLTSSGKLEFIQFKDLPEEPPEHVIEDYEQKTNDELDQEIEDLLGDFD